jgi:lactam utilization protein B
MRGAARRQFVRPHHAMYQNVVADAHHAAAAAVIDLEILVGDTAGQRLWLDAPLPDRKRGDP